MTITTTTTTTNTNTLALGSCARSSAFTESSKTHNHNHRGSHNHNRSYNHSRSDDNYYDNHHNHRQDIDFELVEYILGSHFSHIPARQRVVSGHVLCGKIEVASAPSYNSNVF